MWLQLDKQQFEETILALNNLYAEAEKLGGKSYLEGCLACLTAYTIFLCMETHYEKVKLVLGQVFTSIESTIAHSVLPENPLNTSDHNIIIMYYKDKYIQYYQVHDIEKVEVSIVLPSSGGLDRST